MHFDGHCIVAGLDRQRQPSGVRLRTPPCSWECTHVGVILGIRHEKWLPPIPVPIAVASGYAICLVTGQLVCGGLLAKMLYDRLQCSDHRSCSCMDGLTSTAHRQTLLQQLAAQVEYLGTRNKVQGLFAATEFLAHKRSSNLHFSIQSSNLKQV